MSGALLLVLYSAAAGLGAPALLRRDWSAHAPRLGIAAWLALPASVSPRSSWPSRRRSR